jgi:hypothetical protein
MRWTRNSICTAILSLGAAAIIPAAALNAEPIVIKYEGPSSQNYKPGKKLLASAKISLKAGEVLTVLDERGTRTLRGPGTFSATSSANAGNVSNTSLATLIKTSSVRRARTGAVRGESGVQQTAVNPNLWFVDISKGGKICVADFKSIQLWRANTAEAQQISASEGTSGSAATVKFGKGRTTANWPSNIVPRDGGIYSLSVPGKAEKVALQLVSVDVTGQERLDIMASKLLDRGCQVQSELLAATFAQVDPLPVKG